jgi:hypothetical protein
MQRVWSHAVTLLLGITLAVGFYEGRRLVTNTMRALQIGEAPSGLASRLEPDAADAAPQRRDDKRLRTTPRNPSRTGTTTSPLTTERLSPSRSRHRPRPGEPGDPADKLQVMREDGQLPLALPVAPAEDTGEPQP